MLIAVITRHSGHSCEPPLVQITGVVKATAVIVAVVVLEWWVGLREQNKNNVMIQPAESTYR